MSALMNSAPALDPDKLDQIAALPLGGRVKLNPWDDHAELIKTTPVAITSARGKMPLEVTPFFPGLPATEQPSTRPQRRTLRLNLRRIKERWQSATVDTSRN